MGKLKKIGIGFGIVIGLFFALILAVGISIEMEKVDMTPEERQQWEEQREAEKLQREIDEKQAEAILEKSETTQDELEDVNIITMQDIIKQNLKEPIQKTKLDTEEKVLEFITNYKGTDNAGPTLARTFEMISVISYPDENILASPSTTVSMFAHKDFDKADYNRYWKVELEIKTYRETAYYEWIIDNETNLVYPGNDEGKEILDIL